MAQSINGMNILLVDDNEINIEIAKEQLEEAGAVVELAFDGRQAVKLFEKSPVGYYNAILMDLMMPVMDGLTACRTIRALDRADAAGVLIFAVTANAFEEDVRSSKEAGMNELLPKPFRIEETLAAISKYK